jgi:UDP:flavonoid glycosyltransferase YjiC (YdhE family)
MSTFLLCATPVYGHVAPILAVGEHLLGQGHRVLMLTGSRFAERATSAGLEFHALTGLADFDDRDIDSYLPDQKNYKPGLARAQYDIQTIFVKTIPDQFRSVSALAPFVDAIVVDAAFAGASPLAFGDRTHPPVIALGVLPLSQSSPDVAPYGMGMLPLAGPLAGPQTGPLAGSLATTLGRVRNRVLGFVANRILFRATQQLGQRLFREIGGEPGKHLVMDLSTTFDRFLQLSVPEFEYPRSTLSSNTRFIGPVIPKVPAGKSAIAPAIAPAAAPAGELPAGELPEWWADLDGSRPVVHVTQGTIDNHDFSRLIGPTIEALANEDVLVVVTLGGASANRAAYLGALPANVRISTFVDYDLLLPLTDVFVTNAGFGGVQHALAHGVPIVAAGETEDKPEVCARIEWSGVGINLGTGTPTAIQVGDAVSAVLADPSYRSRADAMATAIAASTPFDAIDEELAAVVAA